MLARSATVERGTASPHRLRPRARVRSDEALRDRGGPDAPLVCAGDSPCATPPDVRCVTHRARRANG
jgi:hypothetical protein